MFQERRIAGGGRTLQISSLYCGGAADVRAYLRDRGSEEDYWDYYADLQMLRRHHVTCRTELFGHDPRDPGWSSCGKSREDFTGLRRTMILQQSTA